MDLGNLERSIAKDCGENRGGEVGEVGFKFLPGSKLFGERRWSVHATFGACANLFLGATVHKRYAYDALE